MPGALLWRSSDPRLLLTQCSRRRLGGGRGGGGGRSAAAAAEPGPGEAEAEREAPQPAGPPAVLPWLEGAGRQPCLGVAAEAGRRRPRRCASLPGCPRRESEAVRQPAVERERERGARGGGEDGPGALVGLQPQGCEVEPSGCAARPAGQHLPAAPDRAAGQR